jgi:pimeloyl-ACP methyl ester carboxylesterase
MKDKIIQTPLKSKFPLGWLCWPVIILFTLIVGLYILFPAGMGVAAIFPGQTSVGLPPAGFEAITLKTSDGVALAAWYAPPANGTAIIVLHGAGGSRESIRPYAEMLVRQGYGVLAMDLRGHGESGGKVNRLGWQGTLDVGAAVAYLETRDEVEHIGGLGLSMGGEVLLGAASAYPKIRAIVTDGATRRCTEELLALPSERPLVRNFTARVFYATVQILSRQQPPAPLLNSIVAAESTQFYLIAGGANALEVDFNELFAEKLGARATLWVAPDAAHTEAFNRYPDAYEQQMIAFFEKVGDEAKIIQ